MAPTEGPSGQSIAEEEEQDEQGSIAERARDRPHQHQAQPAPSSSDQASARQTTNAGPGRPLILITDANLAQHQFARDTTTDEDSESPEELRPLGPQAGGLGNRGVGEQAVRAAAQQNNGFQVQQQQQQQAKEVQVRRHQHQHHHHHQHQQHQQGERVEEVDGISYRIVAAVTRPPPPQSRLRASSAASNPLSGQSNEPDETENININNNNTRHQASSGMSNNNNNNKTNLRRSSSAALQTGASSSARRRQSTALGTSGQASRFGSMRRKSSAFVASLFANQSHSSHELGVGGDTIKPARRMSIYELTKSPPPETSIEHYLKERRRSSTVSAKFVQQQLEQQSTFEANYCQRQQYFKDLNEKLINQDRRLLNVVANRGQMHRHSVDIAQLPLELAQAKAKQQQLAAATETLPEEAEEEAGAQGDENGELDDNQQDEDDNGGGNDYHHNDNGGQVGHAAGPARLQKRQTKRQQQQQQQQARSSIDQVPSDFRDLQQINSSGQSLPVLASAAARLQLASISEDNALNEQQKQPPDDKFSKQKAPLRKFQKLDPTSLSSSPAPDVKIGQRVAYKEYYGNEFGTIRWIGRVPQISPNWTVGVEFDNAIGEGDGSLNGRRYFIAKDCFAKFLSLDAVALVDQHVGRPEPGTMISVMSAAVRPGQMISIQRVSTVHVQHCFLNAPHRRPVGADILAVNTRLHCQCPNCGPCAHVVKPPRTQRLRTGKNATHMCQFSTYTCCGMQSQEETLCTYTGNKVSSSPPPPPLVGRSPPFYNSWIEGSGYLSNLQAQQSKLMPEEYRLGAAPEDIIRRDNVGSRMSSKRASGRHHHDGDCPPEASAMVGDDSTRALSSNSHPLTKSQHRKREHRQHRNHNSSRKSHRHRSRSRSPIYTNLQNQSNHNPYIGCSRPCCKSQDNNDLQQLQTSTIHSSIFPTSDRPTERQHKYQQKHSFHDNTVGPPSYKSAISSDNQGILVGSSGTRSQKISTTAGASNAPKNMASTYDGEEARDMNESGALNSIDNALVDDGMPTKPAKVVYRDSIENRYLFPTDDIIDTALEADLDDLSQARYGRLAQGRSNGGTTLGSRNILKSLRSLVSCLSATKSNQSDFEGRSENTLRFYEHPTDGGINKSQPMARDVGMTSSSNDGHFRGTGSNFSGTIDSFDSTSHENGYECTGSNNNNATSSQTIRPYGLATPLSDDCNFFCRHEKSILNPNGSVFGSTSSPSSLMQSENSKFGGKQALSWDALGESIGRCVAREKGNWHGLGTRLHNSDVKSTHHTTTATTNSHINQVRRQISSSSDCGFSSASQNSVNFQSHPSCTSPIYTAEDEQRRINQIYKRIVARLISSTPTSAITNEDLLKLKRTLFEIHSESCCLHSHGEQIVGHPQQNQHHHHESHLVESGECERIIAEGIRTSMLNLNLNSNADLTATVTAAAASSGESDASGPDGTSRRAQNSCTEQRQQPTPSDRQPSQASWDCSNDYANQDSSRIGSQARKLEGLGSVDDPHAKIMEQCPVAWHKSGQASDSMNHDAHNDSTEYHNSPQTLSRSSDKRSYTATRYQAENSMKSTSNLVQTLGDKCDSTTSLPKTFELKLTLSISGDDERLKAYNLHGPKDNLVDSSDSGHAKKDANSTSTQSIKSGPGFNISIVSGRVDSENKLERDKTNDCSITNLTRESEVCITPPVNGVLLSMDGDIRLANQAESYKADVDAGIV